MTVIPFTSIPEQQTPHYSVQRTFSLKSIKSGLSTLRSLRGFPIWLVVRNQGPWHTPYSLCTKFKLANCTCTSGRVEFISEEPFSLSGCFWVINFVGVAIEWLALFQQERFFGVFSKVGKGTHSNTLIWVLYWLWAWNYLNKGWVHKTVWFPKAIV